MLPEYVRDSLISVSKVEPEKKIGESDLRIKMIDDVVKQAKLEHPECFNKGAGFK